MRKKHMRQQVFAQSLGFALYEYGRTGEKAGLNRRLNMNLVNYHDNSFRKVLGEVKKLFD